MSSSCRRIRPARCTSATHAAPSSATCSAACSMPPATTTTREYYFNDFGSQVKNLGASIRAIRFGRPVPEDGYNGDYVHDLAREVPADLVGSPDASAETAETADAADWAVGALGVGAHPRRHRGEPRAPRRPLRRLEDRESRSTTRAGSVARSSGCATPARSTSRTARRGSARPHYGDDKDRVIYRTGGAPTYFAADIGYVTEKFSRGFDRLIYIWGADHHGTVARLLNAAEAMGYPREAVEVLLTAWVRFVRDGVEVSMSKRAGEFITLDDLLAEIGVDAARWFFASRAPSTRHRLRHRACQEAVEREPGLLRAVRARAHRVDPAQGGGGRAWSGPTPSPGRSSARRRPRWRAAWSDCRRSSKTPRRRARPRASRRSRPTSRRPSTRSIGTPASSTPDEPERSRRRLALVEATRITLANALGLLGISAPDAM